MLRVWPSEPDPNQSGPPAAHLFRVALADCPSGLRKGFSGKIEYHCHHFGGGLVFLATDLIGLPGCAVVSEEQVKMS